MANLFSGIGALLGLGDEEIDPSNNPGMSHVEMENLQNDTAGMNAPSFVGGEEDPYKTQLQQDIEAKRAMIAKLRDPEVNALYEEKSKPSALGNIGRFLATAASFTPRGGHIGRAALGLMKGGDAENQAILDKRFEQARALESDIRASESGEIAKEAAARERAKYDDESTAKFKGMETDSPEANFLRQSLGGVVKDPKLQELLKGMSATQLQEAGKSFLPLYNAQSARAEAAARLADVDLSRAQQKEISDRAFAAGQDEKQAKKWQTVNEIEERRQNITDAIEELETMIAGPKDPKTGVRSGGAGTFELFGAHNQNMDRLVDQIATDMAKLQDPNSVARPGEVQLVKGNLVQSGFKNKNATAMDVLEKFKGEVGRRASAAYKIRGLGEPERDEKGNVMAPTGNFNSAEVVKKQYNPKTNQTKFIRSDGTEEVISGRR